MFWAAHGAIWMDDGPIQALLSIIIVEFRNNKLPLLLALRLNLLNILLRSFDIWFGIF